LSASDNDRISYLAGEDVEALAPDERAELDELRGLLDDESVWTEPPLELEDRVVTAIADEARATQADPTPAATPAPAAQPAQAAQPTRLGRPARAARRASAAPPEPPRQRQAHKPRRRFPSILLERPLYMAGALAGVVAIIAVVTLFTHQGGSNGPSQLRFAMVVNGTDLSPGAHGSATLVKESSGWHITLNATGLPHLTNGRYYQAWLKNSAGILVPVGTFNDAVNVTLWSGVPVTQFQTLTVTRQQANGNPASSGQRVLTGTVKTSG
jgi:Anti-sigma-K factor rskA